MITFTKRMKSDRRAREEIKRILSNRRGRGDHREYYNRVYIAGRPQRTSYPGFGKYREQAKKGECQNQLRLELVQIPCWRAHFYTYMDFVKDLL